jgi:hypothetical protein
MKFIRSCHEVALHYAPMEERNYFHNLWCRVSDMDG